MNAADRALPEAIHRNPGRHRPRRRHRCLRARVPSGGHRAVEAGLPGGDDRLRPRRRSHLAALTRSRRTRTRLALTGGERGRRRRDPRRLLGLVRPERSRSRAPRGARDGRSVRRDRPARRRPESGVLAAQREWTDTRSRSQLSPASSTRLHRPVDPEASGSRERRRAEVAAGARCRSRSHSAAHVTLRRWRRPWTRSTGSHGTVMTSDFPEGIRAQVVDKDRNPRWSPSSLRMITDADVALFFAPPADGNSASHSAVAAEGAQEVTMSRIAFIGLGHMGGPMAANLVKAGHGVVGFDLVPAALEAAAQQVSRSSPRPAKPWRRGHRHHDAPQRPACPGCLPRGTATPACWRRRSPGTLFIDCSTIAVDEARAAHRWQRRPATAVWTLRSPAAWSEPRPAPWPSWSAAATRTSQQRRPLLEVMGTRVVHCGGARRGPGCQDLQQHDPRSLHDRASARHSCWGRSWA